MTLRWCQSLILVPEVAQRTWPMKYAVPVQQYMMATVTRYICQGTALGCAKL